MFHVFHVFQVFHVVFMCCMFSCVFIKLRDIMFILQFSLQKRPPQVRFDLPEMQVLKAKVGLVGVIFRRPIQVEN